MKKKKLDSTKEKEFKKKVGSRFRQFRESIGKAQHHVAAELNISQSTIANIERGKAFPNINYLHYFYSNHHMNVNWLITNQGEMVYNRKPGQDKYSELIHLMKIPMIEQVILAKLIELKALLKDDIQAFWLQEEEKKAAANREQQV